MARRDTARYAAMSDPKRNRWFSYRWVPPPPLQRKSPSAPTPGRIFESHINDIKDTAPLTKAQARALAERLFSPGGAVMSDASALRLTVSASYRTVPRCCSPTPARCLTSLPYARR